MASKVGIFALQTLAAPLAVCEQHNPETATPGLPVKAAEIIYQGVLVGYDPANSQAQSADPAMPATARVVGFAEETIDNRTGAKGDLKIKPFAAVGRVKNDGNLTAAHLFKACRVVDDHTVGLPAGTDADRPAGLLIGLDGDFCWVAVAPGIAQRGPVSLAQASATLTGALTGTVDGALADIAATAGACAGGATPTATQVDTAIATAVASIVLGTNEQHKEVQALLNKLSAALVTAGIIAPTA
jgi:hypothetical protein